MSPEFRLEILKGTECIYDVCLKQNVWMQTIKKNSYVKKTLICTQIPLAPLQTWLVSQDVFEVVLQKIALQNRKIRLMTRQAIVGWGGGGSGGWNKVSVLPKGQVRNLVWNVWALSIARIKDMLIITPVLSSVSSTPSPPRPHLPPYLSLPFAFGLCQNGFLFGPRWNRKCWFIKSWSGVRSALGTCASCSVRGLPAVVNALKNTLCHAVMETSRRSLVRYECVQYDKVKVNVVYVT